MRLLSLRQRVLCFFTLAVANFMLPAVGQQSLYQDAQGSGAALEDLVADNNALRERINLTAEQLEACMAVLYQVLLESGAVHMGNQLESLPSLDVVPIPRITLTPEEEEALTRLIVNSPEAIPEFTSTDYFIVGLAGCLAAAYDVFIVATPHTSVATRQVKKWTLKLHEDYLSKLEKKFRVPFDAVPKGPGHRGKSLGHDPLIGLIFGVYDIMTGRSTYVDGGRIISVIVDGHEAVPMPDAIIRWFVHMLSDVFSKHGLPLPGWNTLQLLELGRLGPNSQTIASLARQMYNMGYDLRHYMVGAGSPAIIEIVLRTYHYMGLALTGRPEFDSRADEDIWNRQQEAKLTAMRFCAHALATGANAGKVAFRGAKPPFIQALLSINVAQWQVFGATTFGYIKTLNRDVTLEHIRRNRTFLKEQWSSMPTFEFVVDTPVEAAQ